tara:strand:+ start:1339 stop:1878 length:540 start_codon:yes stop_codon:yes gene_type:complete
MKKYQVLRISSQIDCTNGILYEINPDGTKKFLCYTLEDEKRETKVMHETRIPAGTYKLSLRKEGGFHSRYLKKYGPSFHHGMIHVDNVPGFKYILWHTGNTDEHTSGCLIVGQSQKSNLVDPNGFVSASVSAYKSIYPKVAEAILKEGAEVTYVDYDTEAHCAPECKPKKPPLRRRWGL